MPKYTAKEKRIIGNSLLDKVPVSFPEFHRTACLIKDWCLVFCQYLLWNEETFEAMAPSSGLQDSREILVMGQW